MILDIRELTAEMTWPLRHEVMWPSMPFDFIKLPEDAEGKHFGLFIDSELVSIVSLFQKDTGTAQFRKFATKTNEQGKGYGTKLLLHLIAIAEKENIKKLWCNARLDKTDYYEKFGMTKTNKTYVKENLKFVILEKVF